jgi:predicted Zn finger-like uncharacterized protein
MIVTCPNCETRYLVDDAALGDVAGRRVRCASCGNLWNYSSEAEAIHAAVAELTAEAAMATTTPQGAGAGPPLSELGSEPGRSEPGRTEPRIDRSIEFGTRSAGPTAQARPSVAVELPAAARRRSARAAVLALIVFAAGLVLVAIVGRDRIIAMWPAAAPVYATLHLTEKPGAGLEVTVTPTRTPQSLVIDGNIVNGTTTSRRVPRLRITLRDGSKSDLESKVIDPPVDRLAPGATAHFSANFDHPSITATGVDVTFVTD